MLDIAIGLDATNPPDSVLKWLEQDRYYRWCTYLFIPIQYAGLVFACWLWSSGYLSVAENIGLAMTMGVVGGIAIDAAHELGHKRANSERWLSRVALAQTGYGHFFIEHNRGHHVRVAPRGPRQLAARGRASGLLLRAPSSAACARPGHECARPRPHGQVALDAAQRHPQRLGDDDRSVAILTAVFGLVVLPYLLLQALGFVLLEVVNYLEHYGLLRQKREDGRYERCLPEHSWNSNNVASNVLLYHLQRHSDHHANPTRRYQALRHVDEAPQLPTGYAGMIVLTSFRRCGGTSWTLGFSSTTAATSRDQRPTAGSPPSPRALWGGCMSAWRCPGCGYLYDEEAGRPREGFPPGTLWSEVPDDWACPRLRSPGQGRLRACR